MIWLTGAGYDVVFDLSRTVVMALADVAKLASETVGWPYHHVIPSADHLALAGGGIDE